MTYFLDTNICIHYLNNASESVIKKFNEFGTANIKIPSIVAAELYYGAENMGALLINHPITG